MESDIILYRSIAIEMLYNFAFELEEIGRSVWPQTIKMTAGVGGSFPYLVLLRPFAAERFILSTYT